MVKLNNYARYVENAGEGYDLYEWIVFVDEDEDTLEKIDHVEYLLHPTFPHPRRVVSDRESKFALLSGGWGTFDLKVKISFKDGTYEDTSYRLNFEKEWPPELE